MTTLIFFLQNTTSHSIYRACIYSSSIDKILKKKAISMIIHSLRAVYDEEELQIEGLKMLQILSKTEEGYRQISETQGGWQSMCQVSTSFPRLLYFYIVRKYCRISVFADRAICSLVYSYLKYWSTKLHD